MFSLVCLCAELRSDMPMTRNKAAEQLENHRSSLSLRWTERIRHSLIKTTYIVHIADETNDKNNQALINKNYIYSAIVNKLINYNLEGTWNIRDYTHSEMYVLCLFPDPEHLFSKSTLFNAFQEGFKSRVAILYFSEMFLSILTQGLFKSPLYVRDLKVNEFSSK